LADPKALPLLITLLRRAAFILVLVMIAIAFIFFAVAVIKSSSNPNPSAHQGAQRFGMLVG